MDLYNPLYINRPTVEPELFASLRPVTYSGGFGREKEEIAKLEQAIQEVDKLKETSRTLGEGATNPTSARSRCDHHGRIRKAEAMKLADVEDETTAETRRRHATETAAGTRRRLGTGSVGNAATAGALGDHFQYAIDHPVTLPPRQKSAMLPIVGKDVEGQKVSIYNQNVQKTHPLLGLKFKNTSGSCT